MAKDLFPRNLSNKKPHHLAFLFNENTLISIGTNSYKSSPRIHYFGRKFNVEKYKLYSFPHAEVDAVSKAWSKFYIDSSFSMVVIRMNHLHQLRKSKPCCDCQSIMNAIGIEKIWWSEENQTITNGIKTITFNGDDDV
jgi:hypothetical protein